MRYRIYRTLAGYAAAAKSAYALRAAGYVHVIERKLCPVVKPYHAIAIAGYGVALAFYGDAAAILG